MGIDATEGEGLFRLLDADGNGSLRAEELVEGCLRIRGEARALELSVLTHLTNDVRTQQKTMQEMIQELLEHEVRSHKGDSYEKDSLPKVQQVAAEVPPK